MKKRSLIVLFVIIIFFAQSSVSQVGIFGTFSLPLTDFADDTHFENSGMSAAGIGGGIEYSLSLGTDIVQWSTSGSFMYHFFDKEKTDNDPVLANVDELDGGDYIMFPLLTGVKINILTTLPFSIYGTAQAGLSFIKEENLEGQFLGLDGEITTDWTTPFTFGFGTGIVVADALTLGIRYLNMGNVDLDYERTTNYTKESVQRDFDIALFQFAVGYLF